MVFKYMVLERVLGLTLSYEGLMRVLGLTLGLESLGEFWE